MAGEAEVQVSVGADPADLAKITSNLSNAIGDGGVQGGRRMDEALRSSVTGSTAKLNEALAKSLSSTTSGFGKAGTAAKDFGADLSALSRDSLNIVQAFKEIGAGLTATAAAIDRERSALNRTSIEQNTSLSRASNERLAILRNEGKLGAIEAQRSAQIQLREARTSGQQRVQITRSVLDTIGRLEKGLGTTLAGIARTSVSAVSKVFDGLTSVFHRADRETFNNSTFSSSLKVRESELRESFAKQSTIVRESVSRQEAALLSLRETTQKGVLGAATNAGLLGGLGAGFALFQGIKSTFTVGADFQRGLAVLGATLDLTAEQMKGVRQASIDLGNDITLPGVSALDASQAIGLLAKQFGALGPAAITAAEAAAKGTLQLSRAAGVGAEDAAGAIGAAINVFGISADKAVQVADEIAGALKVGAGVGFTDFADAFKQAGSIFASFQVPAVGASEALVQFNTALAVIAKGGVVGSDAGTSLKQFFLQANRGTDDANAALAEISKRAGVSGTAFFNADGSARAFNETLDILRKGVAGLTDEQRNSTLQTLFGTDATRVANALLSVSTEEYARLSDSVREQGTAAKIAAAQNTGLKGAFDALSSVIETVQIVLFEKFNKPLGNAVLAVTNFANTILFSASPAMHTLRIALLGVAAGLGALLAFKTAVEVLSLLGKAAALALTPMGALALVFAGAGTAIALLADSNDGFVDKLLSIRDAAVALGRDLLTKLQPVIETISSFIQTTAIPTAVRWAGVVARDLRGAFDATVRFFQDTVIPGFQRFVGFLETDVFPRVASVAEIVGNALVTAKNTVVTAATTIGSVVGPLIQPAIEGFQKLGAAVVGFVTGGGFSQIGSGLASAGSGILSSFANIGQAIGTALAPVAKQVLDFFKHVFSVDNLIGAVGAIGDFLNFIGEKLGSIVSNPKVLAAVGIVAGVAAKLAFDLVSGVVEGIASNIPQLLADVWQLAVKFAFKPEVLIGALVAAVAAVQIGKLVTSFKAFGTSASNAFSDGFGTGIKRALTGAGDFTGGLFGSLGAGSDSQKALGSYKKEIQGLQNQLRVLGSTSIIDPTSATAIQDAKNEINQLGKGVSDARLKGLQFRDAINTIGVTAQEVLGGGSTIVRGLAQVVTALGKAGKDGFEAFRTNFKAPAGAASASFIVDSLGSTEDVRSVGAGVGRTFAGSLADGLEKAGATIKAGFTRAVDGLRTAAAESGTSVGKLVAGGLAKGVAGATAGIFFGQQIGQSKGGIDTLLGLGGLATTALAIGGPIGVATGAIGLLTAAFTSGTDEGEIFRQKVDSIVQELQPKLVQAAKDGKFSLDQLKAGLTFSDIDTSGVSDSVQGIFDSLGGDSKAKLRDFNIAFQDAFGSIVDSGKPFKEVSQDIRTSLIDTITSSDDFINKFGPNASKIAQLLQDVVKPGGASSLGAGNTLQGVDQTVKDLIFKNSDYLKSITDLSNDVTSSVNANQQAIEDASDAAFGLAKNVSTAGTTALQEAGTAAAAFGQAVVDANTTGGLSADKVVDSIDRIKQAFVATDISTAGLDLVNEKLGDIVAAKDTIDAKFRDGILPPNVTGFEDALNQALVQVQGIGKGLDDISSKALSGEITLPQAGAQTEQSLKNFSQLVSNALAKGVKDGTILTPADAATLLAPLVTEAQTGAGPEAAQKIQDAFNALIVTFTPTINESAAQTAAQSTLETVKGILENAKPFVIPTTVGLPSGLSTADATFATDVLNQAGIQAVKISSEIDKPTLIDGWEAAAQAEVDVATAGLTPPVLPGITVPEGFAQNAIAASASGGAQSGAAVTAGMVRGIQNGASSVAAAAARAAQGAVKAANLTLGIHSPSVVFQTIGKFMMSGLVKGIADGSSDVVSTVTKAVEDAVDAATGAVNAASKALRGGSSSLFSALFGSDSAVGKSSFTGIQGSITDSFNSLASTLDSSFDKAADVLKRSATEALSRADLDILGEAGNSLNARDVLGAANRGALTGTLDEIVALGKAMIDQGAPAAQVTTTLRQYIDHTRALAVQYGLNGGEVDALIDSLGLGNASLDGFVQATSRMAEILGTTTTNAEKFNDQVVDLFKGVTDGSAFKSITGVGAAEDAFAAITAGFGTLASAVDAVDQRAQAIIDKRNRGEQLSVAETLALNQGLNNRGIGLGDQLSVSNRQAFEAQIENIKKMGEALLDGGSTAAYVTSQIQAQVQALENYGQFLGFNRDQIQDLVNKAGLGADSLARFNQSVTDAQTVADQAARAQAVVNQNNLNGVPTPGGLPTAANNFNPDANQPVRDVIVNQYLPYADPAAISLAAANGVASAVRLPV